MVGVNQVILNVGMKSSPNLNCRSFITPAMMIMANHLLFLLLSLYAMAASAQVFVSIDCGSNSDVYTDKNGITWSGDDSYIKTGENKVVRTRNPVSQEMKTLRMFSSDRTKNCYSIIFSKGKKVLVRASFYYGNYDKKSSPPSFDLQVDGNHWTTVDTSTSKDVISKEIIYVSRKDTISVCLALTKRHHLPFISALEVISLDYKMYGHVDSSYALFLEKRIALGAKETIRYPDDKYGRKWIAVQPSAKGYNAVASVTSEINTSDSLDDPPSSVLQNAWTTVNRPRILLLETGLPKMEVPVYIKWYFSEVTAEVYSTKQRRFTILIDGEPFGCPIVPSYGAVTEEYIVNFNASSKTKFTLVSTYNSKLPPLINAMEVFRISDEPLTDGTNNVDVEQLSLLQTQFDVLAGWTGDPCLPAAYKWDWVACSSDKIPRITALYLSHRGLSGTLPNFSSMVALQVIELYNNSLTGEFPSFLGDLPNLQELNLADNDFSGSVPTSMSENKKLILKVAGNQRLCTSASGSCEDSTPSSSETSSDSSTKLGVSSNQKSHSSEIRYSRSDSSMTTSSWTSSKSSTNFEVADNQKFHISHGLSSGSGGSMPLSLGTSSFDSSTKLELSDNQKLHSFDSTSSRSDGSMASSIGASSDSLTKLEVSDSQKLHISNSKSSKSDGSMTLSMGASSESLTKLEVSSNQNVHISDSKSLDSSMPSSSETSLDGSTKLEISCTSDSESCESSMLSRSKDSTDSSTKLGLIAMARYKVASGVKTLAFWRHFAWTWSYMTRTWVLRSKTESEASSNQNSLISDSKSGESSMPSSVWTSSDASSSPSTNNVKGSSKLLFWEIMAFVVIIAFVVIVYKYPGFIYESGRNCMGAILKSAGTIKSTWINPVWNGVVDILQRGWNFVIDILQRVYKLVNPTKHEPTPDQLDDQLGTKAVPQIKNTTADTPDQAGPQTKTTTDKSVTQDVPPNKGLFEKLLEKLPDLGLIEEIKKTWKSIELLWIKVYLLISLISLLLNFYGLWFLVTKTEQKCVC